MKFFVFGTLILSFAAVAKDDLRTFQYELLTDVKAEIHRDDDHLKKKTVGGRGPASVKPRPRFESAPKIDKTVKQMGHADW